MLYVSNTTEEEIMKIREKRRKDFYFYALMGEKVERLIFICITIVNIWIYNNDYKGMMMCMLMCGGLPYVLYGIWKEIKKKKEKEKEEEENKKNGDGLWNLFAEYVLITLFTYIFGSQYYIHFGYCVLIRKSLLYINLNDKKRKRNVTICIVILLISWCIADRIVIEGYYSLGETLKTFTEQMIMYKTIINMAFLTILFACYSHKVKDDLILLKKKLEFLKDSKYLFITKFSRNVKTALDYMIPFCEEIKDSIQERIGILDTDLAESFDILDKCSHSVLNLVKQFNSMINLDLDLDKKEQKLRIESFDLYDLIMKIVIIQRRLRVEYKSDRVQIIINIDRNSFPKMIRGDKNRLSQIVENLISNAFKYTDHGKVIITAEYDADNKEFELVIQDEGCGIEKEMLQKIFQPFANCNDPNSSKPSINLGLSITKELCNVVKGELDIDSQGKGHGTTATFKCKLKPAKDKTISVFDGVNFDYIFNFYKFLTFLVVEDNKFSKQVMELMLTKRLPFTKVEYVENGIEALKTLNNKSFDIIFMPFFFNSIIVVTATSDNEKNDEGKMLMNRFLEKPVELEHIKKVIIDYLYEQKNRNKLDMRMKFSKVMNRRSSSAVGVIPNDLHPKKKNITEKTIEIDKDDDKLGEVMSTTVEKKESNEVVDDESTITKKKKVKKEDKKKQKFDIIKKHGIAIVLISVVYTIGYLWGSYVILKVMNGFLPLRIISATVEYFCNSYEYDGVEKFFHLTFNLIGMIYLWVCVGSFCFPTYIIAASMEISHCMTVVNRKWLPLTIFSICVLTIIIVLRNFQYLFNYNHGTGLIGNRINDNVWDYMMFVCDIIILIKIIVDVFTTLFDVSKSQTELKGVLQELNDEENQSNSFIAKVSHDLRNPISGFSSYLENIKSILKEKYQIEIFMMDVFNNLLFSANSITTDTNNLVNYYKIKHKKIKIQLVVVDIIREIKDVVDFQKLIGLVGNENVNVELNFDESIPTFVEVDIVIFKEIMSKLVSNSIKYTDSGSVIIDCFYEDCILSVSIKDSGCGISKSELKEIFDPFTHLYCSKNEKPSGSLGLLISRKLSKILGGNLSLTSDGKRKGTTSHIIIPMSPKEEIDELPEDNNEKFSFDDSISVLIVDDSVVISKLLKLWLTKSNIKNISSSLDVPKAITLINENEFDIILLDFYIGTETTAFDILKHLHNLNDNNHHSKVILVTGAIFTEIEIEKLKEFDSTIIGILKKPLKIENFKSFFAHY